jgi:DNA topoisomerase-1
MRTDNPNLSDDALAEIYTVCQAKGLPMVDRPRTWKAKDGAQEAHEAIRPSHFEVEAAGETEDEKALYKLIWDRAVACQLAAARYAVRVARLQALDVVDGKAVEFLAEGRTQTFAGWTALFADDTEDGDAKKKNDTPDNPIPMLEPGQTISAIEGKVLTKKTRAPSRYTQAALVKELERLGIGRPSTYAAIMDTISKRGYVEHDKAGKYLVPTELGETVLDALVKGNFSFIENAVKRLPGEKGKMVIFGVARDTLIVLLDSRIQPGNLVNQNHLNKQHWTHARNAGVRLSADISQARTAMTSGDVLVIQSVTQNSTTPVEAQIFELVRRVGRLISM